MPKTIAITPSWYWPSGIPRVIGVPPFSVYELCVLRHAKATPGATAIAGPDRRLTYAELHSEVERAAAAVTALAQGGHVVLPASVDVDSAVALLGAFAAGVRIRTVRPGNSVPGPLVERLASAGGDGPIRRATSAELTAPAVTIDGVEGPVHHSQRSLLAMAISLATYLDASREQPWLLGLAGWRWEGLAGLLLPLYLGATAVLVPEQADEAALTERIVREQTAFVFHDLAPVALAAREAKKEAKRARDVLSAFLLTVPGSFEPDQRRRVSKAFDCPALTLYGLPETGPIFAAHPSWYLDESVGLPLTNAHVVPADPRTGVPIQTLWELVESAEVTLSSPMLFGGYEGEGHPERFVDGRYRTRMIASSDPNGMIYLLGE